MLKNLKQSSSNEIIAKVSVHPESPWFSGHFHNEPILPGIALLEMVFNSIREFADSSLKISCIKKVRFKQVIRPNDNLKIVATSDEKNPKTYYFNVMIGEKVACKGIMITDNAADE